ncbi:MAG TPA: Ger(x)C family spore germination protein [Virgibacillus sp.]|nr:Ger(x)C family spore germination protein [Virgibacillus sp.]HLR65937.1 Ger(x)C family spore germination protein [Virgibacillus sp.]
MKKHLVFLFLFMFILSSCIPTREIEKLGIINTRGVDKLDDNQIKSTLMIFRFSAQANEYTAIVSGKGNTIKGATENANLETDFRLTPFKIQLEVYGNETAKKGILPFIDTLYRDAALPDSVYLSITNKSANELLMSGTENSNMNIGQYLHGLIEENSNDHQFPRVDLHEFLRTFYNVGKDPILPLFDATEGVPKITSIAIMQDDRYIGNIPADNKIFFNLLLNNVEDQKLELTLPIEPLKSYLDKEENIKIDKDTVNTAFNIIKGSSKTTLIDRENGTFQTDIKLNLELLETTEQIRIKNMKITRLFEKEVEKAIKTRYKKILNQLQEYNADSFGYGAIYRTKTANGELERSEWRKKFPEINVKFNVDANINRHGSVD